MNENDTIVAVATPPGMGGIGIVRASGPDALPMALSFFQPHRTDISLDTFPRRQAIYGEVVDRETNQPIDRGLLTWFAPGRSYTGESVVEISCHGSRPILRRVVELFCEKGARPSGPGEFTLRAVLAGRLDLTQAEAVNRLIRADTLAQAEDAVRQLDGVISESVKSLENDLINLIAAMEVSVDFAEEGDSVDMRPAVNKIGNTILNKLNTIVDGFSRADILRDGAVVVIAGKSNAGKSTLFNSLLKRERAIVDAAPGTTRDFISETIDLDGLPVTLFDTAGLRQGGESVEREGMRRSEELILSADLVVHLTVAGEELSPEDERISRKIAEKNIDRIHAVSKIDRFNGEMLEGVDAGISAVTGAGIDNLIEIIRNRLHVDELVNTKGFVTEKRQQQLFIAARDHILEALRHVEQGMYEEVVLEELNRAMLALSEITGRGGTEEILSRVFGSFCIGK